jgi:hypothetical protein
LIKTATSFPVNSNVAYLKVESNGDVKVDYNMRGAETGYVKYTHAGTSTDIASFTVSSECPAITPNHGALTAPSTEIVPVVLATTKKEIITNTYVTNPSTHS